MGENAAGQTIFFRHLPKTAGTSLITTLANVYGEARCHRFSDVDGSVAERVRESVDRREGDVALMSGHVSLATVAGGTCADEFTVLREPIARLLSMRRFFERLSAPQRESLGFGERISVRDLLESRHPQVFGQVRNGIARFFCGPHPVADPESSEYWSTDFPVDAAMAAESALRRMAVGTVEDMPTALRAIARRLGVPYALEAPTENATNRSDDGASVDDIRALVEANPIDLALFHAIEHHLARRGAGGLTSVGRGNDPRTLFDPRPGERYRPPWIPGRQGFEICRVEKPMSWIGPTTRGLIHLAPSEQALVLTVVMFAISPHDPVDRVDFRVDGRLWARSLVRGPGHEVFRLEPLPPHEGVLEVSVEQPAAVPVSVVDPSSADDRNLGMALLEIGSERA